MNTKQLLKADIVLVGAGSAGFGAAVGALIHAKSRAHIVLIDRQQGFGGTPVYAGVCNWASGIGGPGIHSKIYEELLRSPGAVCITKQAHFCTAEEPWGLEIADPGCPYEKTLRQIGIPPASWRNVQYEPSAMARVMRELLNGADGRITPLFDSVLLDAETCGERIRSVTAWNQRTRERLEIAAKLFIDATGCVNLARKAGCATRFGDGGESPCLNGVTLMFRVTPSAEEEVGAVPDAALRIDNTEWIEKKLLPGKVIAQFSAFPNGDLNVNMLPTMEGNEFFREQSDEMRKIICESRVRLYWNWAQRQYPFFRSYAFGGTYPFWGIRESYRLAGRFVLDESEVEKGFLQQTKKERIIAFGDHGIDMHGEQFIQKEFNMPYGIPYDALLPKEYENLIVACRGASLSQMAASSFRIQKNMIAIGEAAGAAAALALQKGSYPQAPASKLREILGIPRFEEQLARDYER